MRKHDEEIITKAQRVVPADFSKFLICILFGHDMYIFLNVQPNWLVFTFTTNAQTSINNRNASFQIVCPGLWRSFHHYFSGLHATVMGKLKNPFLK